MRKSPKMNLALLSLCGVCSLGAQETGKITGYLQALKYDPRTLLTVHEPGSSESLPARTDEGTTLIICTNKKKVLDADLHQITILSPSANALYPGALVKANANLAAGRPDLISLAPGALTLSVDLPNLGESGSVLVREPKKSTVQAGIDTMLGVWFKNGKNVQAARQDLVTKKAYSSEQVALALGIRSKWGGDNAFKLDSDLNHRAKSSTCISLFKQIYYTVSVDPPQQPGEAFGPKVTLANVQSVANASAPPAYVKSIDYGRIILIRMDTQSAETEANLTQALKYATAGKTGPAIKADLKAKYEKITNNSTFTVMTLGGNAKDATTVMKGSDEAQDNLFKLIQGSAQFNKQNPGYPIAYTVNFLKDNAAATIACTTDYMEQNCTAHEGGFVRVQNDAAVVGAFQVWWTDKDEKGKSVPKFWESGRTAIGYGFTVNMGPEATKVRVTGTWHNGSSWRQVFDKTVGAPDNKIYRMKGTAFGMSYEVK
jgi:thiol-activated cytolysin